MRPSASASNVTSSRGKTLSMKASNCPRASIPRGTPLVELAMARMAVVIAASSGSSGCIPLFLENPKIGGVDDAKVVGDRIAEDGPFFWHFLPQEMQYGIAEIVVGGVASVVGHMFMH